MIEDSRTSGVVVGIDGSAAAVDAGLWAVDEAVELGVPLRLVCVIEPSEHPDIDAQAQSHRVATAEAAVRSALTALESTGRAVELEREILHGRPIEALLAAAQSAAMLCVGARGLKHATRGRIGSTAAALSATARCPVAIVRTHRPHTNATDRAVVIEVDNAAESDTVLQRGLEEARRRRASVRVLTPVGTISDVQPQRQQRRLAEWQRRYPDLDITSVQTRGDTLDYLAANADSIQLVVAGRERAGGVAALVGPPGNAALRDSDCSILICEPHNAL
ncbi:Universal stress protein [Mycolicibacterium vanbaalenii]|uniref:Universal stress protein n=1 Tax=Mycolicibacterium vanbaalenii TaxID=110539 RepID=A0A5S9NZK5_MYCVN|nr:universal stress protein [Mycolicibacterium vanbaalenii]CAA0096293.1 Universal stress protein [Mycolicibacterium vanbaalenii]